ncbi:protein spaetzle-like isoform X2 [Coccinella septempunctata]|uniref:protein spaetzle-like isoform X2 n=1 Tax=Coccinella septempunctata TaxID=41139 RepID=UPI001D09462F|nr:protein spaetzle-like isoform X2 [Coccinella septempunctata]
MAKISVLPHPRSRPRNVEAVPVNKTISERIAKLRIISLTSNTSKEARNRTDQEVVFPEDYDVLFDPIPRINGIPKCSKGDTFCEDFEAYPRHHLRQVLSQKEGLREFFGKDEEAPFIVNRHGGLEESVNYLCPSVERTVFPKVGKNKNNKWKYIINQAEDGYIQGVRVETCRRRNAPCDIISDLPLGYITSCKQKYIYRRLLSVSDLGAPTPDTFQLPSACCCSYKRDMDFLARHGSQKLKAVTSTKTFKLS